MVHHSSCPLCSSDKINPCLDTSDYFLSGENFTLFGCSSCGFVFTQDHPDEASAGRYYESEEYLSHNDNKKGLLSRIYKFTREIMIRRKVRLVTGLSGKNSGNLLDIGSGTGHFIQGMKGAGWHAEGIEISEKARAYSIAELGLDVKDPEQIKDLKPEIFDCITLWHVLEHFNDFFFYTGEIKRLLRKDGFCIIALPNCRSHDAQYYSKFWAAYDVPRHLWHFTPETLEMLAEKTGFEIKEILTLPLDVFYISILSEKYKGVNLPFISGLLKGCWFSVLSMFNKKRSSSLIYVLSHTSS